MVLDLDPAALGGLAGLIALAGWAVGRMQGGLPEPDAPPTGLSPGAERTPVPPIGEPACAPEPVCRQRAFAERRALHAAPVSLADLHEEAAAIRRYARIFEQDAAGGALFALARSHDAGDCRYLGISGQPTCPVSRACVSCGAAQLSPEPPSLTRV